jgi:hypothetical protein
VINTGWALLAVGAPLTIAGAILLGIGNYYRWVSRFAERVGVGVARIPGGGSGAMSLRF